MCQVKQARHSGSPDSAALGVVGHVPGLDVEHLSVPADEKPVAEAEDHQEQEEGADSETGGVPGRFVIRLNLGLTE